ncbi:MAG TPA: GNAT family N-acetyltransferase [Thermoleophilaceae bacterium]
MPVRAATAADVPLLLALIGELAEYERLADHAVGTEEQLARHLFGPNPAADAVLAEVDGEPAGFAVLFSTFSTFVCRPGIWLDDLFVRPEHRRAGIGQALLRHVAAIAVERGCGRMEWSALDWNEPALAFYGSLGARPVEGWTTLRLEGPALDALGGGAAAA